MIMVSMDTNIAAASRRKNVTAANPVIEKSKPTRKGGNGIRNMKGCTSSSMMFSGTTNIA